ncbi:uncharacterized protein LOC127909489 [Oncorhynchus keta]|uniref:uncharacterized protein LOC127909489 n=1 Tax=Oncorhynchus keta TaxID=8018 RepID=UPI00227D22B8|nr:uncharacterized protein LOC127909489 [Oncorhynchus keta]
MVGKPPMQTETVPINRHGLQSTRARGWQPHGYKTGTLLLPWHCCLIQLVHHRADIEKYSKASSRLQEIYSSDKESDMLVLCVISVLSLLSVGLAAPLSCEDLLRPARTIGGKCISMTSEITMENNTFTSTGPLLYSLTYLNTCPDCLLVQQKLSLVSKYSTLYIFSKRKELTSAELEVFKKQVDCLNLPPAVFTNPQKDSCPDPTQDNSKTLDLAKVIELLSDTIDLQKTLEEMISKLQLASNKAD